MPTVDRERVRGRITGLVHAAARRAPRAELTAQTAGLTAAELDAVVAGLAVWAARATSGAYIGKRAGETDGSLRLEEIAAMFPRGVLAPDLEDALDRYAA